MPIFTARENFKSEFVTGNRRCESCHAKLQGTTSLVVRWTNKRGEQSLALCDDECWSNYDHNFWLERRAKREFNYGDEEEADRLLDIRLPKY